MHDSTCIYYKWTFSVDAGMTLRLNFKTPCELECIVATYTYWQTKQWLPHSQALRCGQKEKPYFPTGHSVPNCFGSHGILNYTRLFAQNIFVLVICHVCYFFVDLHHDL